VLVKRICESGEGKLAFETYHIDLSRAAVALPHVRTYCCNKKKKCEEIIIIISMLRIRNRRLQLSSVISLLFVVAVLISMKNVAMSVLQTNEIATSSSDKSFYYTPQPQEVLHVSPQMSPFFADKDAIEMSNPNGSEEKAVEIINANASIGVEYNRPILILHIGPPKTGSTTIQSFLRKDQRNGILAKSNFTFFECNEILRVYYSTNITDWHRFSSCLDLVRGKNAIYSNEVFGKFFGSKQAHYDNLKELTKDWHVKIVFSYRRLFEWLPSFYYQRFQGTSTWNKRDFTTFPQFFRKTKTQRIEKFPPFGKKHPTQFLLEKFASHFDDIKVFNMNEDKYATGLVANFYCSVFPDDNDGACEYWRKHGRDKSKNVGQSVNYDLLAYAAKEAGLLDDEVERTAITSAIKNRQENILNITANDFAYQDCLSTEEETLFLNKSLEFEQQLFPEWFKSKGGEVEHRAKFEAAIRSQKFCTVNAKEVIQKDEGWRSFFSEIKIFGFINDDDDDDDDEDDDDDDDDEI